MAYILSSDSKGEKEFEAVYGRYNDAPPNFKEITREEFDRVAFGSYLPANIDYKQIRPNKELGFKSFTSTTLYVYSDGTGVAAARVYDDKTHKWGLRFFKFAKCEHESRELSQAECREAGVYHAGNCYHVYRCTKCGYTNSVDTSD